MVTSVVRLAGRVAWPQSLSTYRSRGIRRLSGSKCLRQVYNNGHEAHNLGEAAAKSSHGWDEASFVRLNLNPMAKMLAAKRARDVSLDSPHSLIDEPSIDYDLQHHALSAISQIHADMRYECGNPAPISATVLSRSSQDVCLGRRYCRA